MGSTKPPETPSPQATIHGMVSAVYLARAVYVAAELGLADLLHDGPRDAGGLAQLACCDTDSLYRLLRFLAGHGIFREDDERHFHLTPLAAVLQTEGPGSVRAAVRMWDDPRWRTCGALLHSVQTGAPAFDHLYGMNTFGYWASHPAEQARFDAAMAKLSEGENVLVAREYDFSRFAKVVDVAGGRGGLIAEILKAHPTVRGTLYDQPQVVEQPTYVVAAGVVDRCDVVGGDMFRSVPEGADAYVVKRILHDWDDDRCVVILRNCREAMSPHGRVLVIDAIVPPGNDPHPSKTADIAMMLIGGRERTEAEFRALYERAGLRLTRTLPTTARTAMVVVEGERA